MFLLWQGASGREGRHQQAPLLTVYQVIGDLWEKYLKMLDEGTNDGSVSTVPLVYPLLNMG